MDTTDMNIDRNRVRQLRESRGWSQEHLAEAAGVGVRTVQRMETDGRCSGESRLAIAAALGVDASSFNVITRPAFIRLRSGVFWGTVFGFSGTTVGMFSAWHAIAQAPSPDQGLRAGLVGAMGGLFFAALAVLLNHFRARELAQGAILAQ